MYEDQRATTHFESSIVTGSLWPCVSTGASMSRQGLPARRTTWVRGARLERARQRLSAPCRYRTFMSRQGLGLGLGGWGCDKGLLYHDKVLLVLCRDRGRCRDKMWSRPGGLMSRHNNCVVIGWRNGRARRALSARCSAHDRRPYARAIMPGR